MHRLAAGIIMALMPTTAASSIWLVWRLARKVSQRVQRRAAYRAFRYNEGYGRDLAGDGHKFEFVGGPREVSRNTRAVELLLPEGWQDLGANWVIKQAARVKINVKDENEASREAPLHRADDAAPVQMELGGDHKDEKDHKEEKEGKAPLPEGKYGVPPVMLHNLADALPINHIPEDDEDDDAGEDIPVPVPVVHHPIPAQPVVEYAVPAGYQKAKGSYMNTKTFEYVGEKVLDGGIRIGAVKDNGDNIHYYCPMLVAALRDHAVFRTRTNNLAISLVSICKSWCEDHAIGDAIDQIGVMSVALAIAISPSEDAALEVIGAVVSPGILTKIANWFEGLTAESIFEKFITSNALFGTTK